MLEIMAIRAAVTLSAIRVGTTTFERGQKTTAAPASTAMTGVSLMVRTLMWCMAAGGWLVS